VFRDKVLVSEADLVSMLINAAEAYKATGEIPGELDEQQILWFAATQRAMRFTLTRLKEDAVAVHNLEEAAANGTYSQVQKALEAAAKNRDAARAAASLWAPAATGAGRLRSASDDSDEHQQYHHELVHFAWPEPEPLEPNPLVSIGHAAMLSDRLLQTMDAELPRGVFKIYPGVPHWPPSHRVRPEEPLSTAARYTMFEFFVPLETAGECALALVAKFGANPRLRRAFRSAILVRFNRDERALLSPTPTPTIAFNLEDFLSANTGDTATFQEVTAVFRTPACSPAGGVGARRHLGKAGWSDGPPHQRILGDDAFDGEAEYGRARWTVFGCVANALDPGGKFRGASKLWQWSGQDLHNSSGYCARAGLAPDQILHILEPDPVHSLWEEGALEEAPSTTNGGMQWPRMWASN